MKFRFVSLLMLSFSLPCSIDAYQGDNPWATVIAFLAGCGINAGFKKQPKIRKTINLVAGGAYLIAPIVNILGYTIEKTVFSSTYQNSTYDFSDMFPTLFLCYVGGAQVADIITDKPQNEDKSTDQHI